MKVMESKNFQTGKGFSNEAVAGGSSVLDQPGLHSKTLSFERNLKS
jgi:hypothetical protein